MVVCARDTFDPPTHNPAPLASGDSIVGDHVVDEGTVAVPAGDPATLPPSYITDDEIAGEERITRGNADSTAVRCRMIPRDY